VRPSHCFSSHN